MQFSNLCGTVYRSGNLLFTPDGKSILSPVGNRVTVFDLTQYAPVTIQHMSLLQRTTAPPYAGIFLLISHHRNKAHTLPFESRKDIARITLSPNGAILIVVDEGALPSRLDL